MPYLIASYFLNLRTMKFVIWFRYIEGSESPYIADFVNINYRYVERKFSYLLDNSDALALPRR